MFISSCQGDVFSNSSRASIQYLNSNKKVQSIAGSEDILKAMDSSFILGNVCCGMDALVCMLYWLCSGVCMCNSVPKVKQQFLNLQSKFISRRNKKGTKNCRIPYTVVCNGAKNPVPLKKRTLISALYNEVRREVLGTYILFL